MRAFWALIDDFVRGFLSKNSHLQQFAPRFDVALAAASAFFELDLVHRGCSYVKGILSFIAVAPLQHFISDTAPVGWTAVRRSATIQRVFYVFDESTELREQSSVDLVLPERLLVAPPTYRTPSVDKFLPVDAFIAAWTF